MKRIFYILIFTCIYSFHSCTDKYPTDYTKDLPFGLEYNMTEHEAHTIVDSLARAGIVELYCEERNGFSYKFLHDDEEIALSASLRFYNDSLYEVDVRRNGIGKQGDGKKHYLAAIDFFKSQKINLASYKKEHDGISGKYEFDYKKYPYEISLYATDYSLYGLIMVFSNTKITDLLYKKELQFRRKVRMDGESFCESIMGLSVGIYKATITDAGFLVIGVRPINNPNFDYFAQSYLEQALNAGIQIKGCFVVDIDKSTWLNGAVKGERIGKAYR